MPRRAKITMKRYLCVMMLFIFILGLSACDQIKKVTSHYGHGRYYCYYFNEQTNAAFKAVSGDKSKALDEAKKACIKAGYNGANQCFLADCVFK